MPWIDPETGRRDHSRAWANRRQDSMDRKRARQRAEQRALRALREGHEAVYRLLLEQERTLEPAYQNPDSTAEERNRAWSRCNSRAIRALAYVFPVEHAARLRTERAAEGLEPDVLPAGVDGVHGPTSLLGEVVDIHRADVSGDSVVSEELDTGARPRQVDVL